jgi:putative ATP-dependent endonuclease of the OLD family
LSNSSQILFSNNVVIAEGRTEQRLLPDIYEQMRGLTLSANKTALVSPGGSGNTVKCLNILTAMEIPAKAVVDLDFAFKNAVKSSLLSEDDPDICECTNWMENLAKSQGFPLSDDGFPKKGGAISPSDAFALLSKQPEVKQHIENLHQKLKENNIWLWKNGAIEDYLGIEGKNEKAWAKYKVELYEKGFEETLLDSEGMKSFIDWI